MTDEFEWVAGETLAENANRWKDGAEMLGEVFVEYEEDTKDDLENRIADCYAEDYADGMHRIGGIGVNGKAGWIESDTILGVYQ